VTRDLNRYEAEYLSDYGFERTMVSYRHQFLMERMKLLRPDTIWEIGCGPELLCAAFQSRGGRFLEWIAIEPIESFCRRAREAGVPNLQVLHGTAEDWLPRLAIRLPAPDYIICSGLLHEVSSADEMLGAIVNAMGPNTILHVNVPNAKSLHRVLAVEMGIISHEAELGKRNRSLQQTAVYDARQLAEAMVKAGLRITCEGGFMLKPFPHAMMEQIRPYLGEQVLDGLYGLGKRRPELSAEIFIEAARN